jgi:hypothetical protein
LLGLVLRLLAGQIIQVAALAPAAIH